MLHLKLNNVDTVYYYCTDSPIFALKNLQRDCIEIGT